MFSFSFVASVLLTEAVDLPSRQAVVRADLMLNNSDFDRANVSLVNIQSDCEDKVNHRNGPDWFHWFESAMCGYHFDCPLDYSLDKVANTALQLHDGPEAESPTAIRDDEHSRVRKVCEEQVRAGRTDEGVDSGAWCYSKKTATLQPGRVGVADVDFWIPEHHVAPDSAIIEVLTKHILPRADGSCCYSITDFGAGVGQYGHALKSLLPKLEYHGYDGAGNVEEFTHGFLQWGDVAKPSAFKRTDWVLSTEVGEHIPHEHESGFITNLHATNCKGIVLTWAGLGQAGHRHVNCHSREYLVNIFEKLGYRTNEELSKMLQAPATPRTEHKWFDISSIAVFERKEVPPGCTGAHPLPPTQSQDDKKPGPLLHYQRHNQPLVLSSSGALAVEPEGEKGGNRFTPSLTRESVFVINLDERADRWEIMQKQFKSFDIDAVRVPAISASGPHKFERDEHVVRSTWNTSWNAQSDHRITPDQVLTLTDSEYACAVSHIKIWKLIVSKNLPAALILEDDAVLGKNFDTVLSAALREVPAAWDMLYAGYFESELSKPTKVSEHIYESGNGVFGTHGYMLTQTGARKLLQLLPMVQPVDGFLAKNAQEKQLDAYLVEPKVVWQDPLSGSNVYHSAFTNDIDHIVDTVLQKSIMNKVSTGRIWLSQHRHIVTAFFVILVFIAIVTSKCLTWSSYSARVDKYLIPAKV